jgi:hypothetical protein
LAHTPFVPDILEQLLLGAVKERLLKRDFLAGGKIGRKKDPQEGNPTESGEEALAPNGFNGGRNAFHPLMDHDGRINVESSSTDAESMNAIAQLTEQVAQGSSNFQETGFQEEGPQGRLPY